MFKGMGLRGRLYAGFGAVLLIALALGAFAFTRLTRIHADSSNITADCLPGIFAAEEIQKRAVTLMLLPARHILAHDKPEMDAIQAEMDKVKAEIGTLLKQYEATIVRADDRALFDRLTPARERFAAINDQEVLPASRLGKKAEALAAFNSRLEPAFSEYAKACQAMVDYNEKSGEDASGDIMGSVTSAKEGISIGLFMALTVGAAIGFFLSRSICSVLNRVITGLASGSEQVATASNQVSQSSQKMAEGASEQASSLEETSASLEEMSSMTKLNSENTRQANTMALDTRAAVEKSREAMARMGEAINKIKGSSDQTAKIVKTIDEIAFQTNLLALNAAVEAARAGDAGKGFAVVAEEVRNLAQRSAEAAKNTASLIEESQHNANNGVAVSTEVEAILSQVVERVQSLSAIIGEVSTASDEQSKGIGQIGTAMTAMDQLTQSNAANAEESASASEQLAAQANELGELMQALVAIVKGQGAQSAMAGPSSKAGILPQSVPLARAATGYAPEKVYAVKTKTDWVTGGRGSRYSAAPSGLPVAGAAPDGFRAGNRDTR